MHKPTKLRSTDMPEDEEFHKLQRRLDRHLDEYRLDTIEREHRDRQTTLAHEANTKSIAALTASVQPLVDAMTAGMILQRFIKWTTGFSGIAILIAWYNDLFKIGG